MEAQALVIAARLIRRGDTFTRHGRTRTATADAYRRGMRGSVVVDVEGGAVWFPKQDEGIAVVRPVRRPTCTD